MALEIGADVEAASQLASLMQSNPRLFRRQSSADLEPDADQGQPGGVTSDEKGKANVNQKSNKGKGNNSGGAPDNKPQAKRKAKAKAKSKAMIYLLLPVQFASACPIC